VSPLLRPYTTVHFAQFGPITYTLHQRSEGKEKLFLTSWPQIPVQPRFKRARTRDFGKTRNIGRAGHEILALDMKNWQ
jgi:hypothetical protein